MNKRVYVFSLMVLVCLSSLGANVVVGKSISRNIPFLRDVFEELDEIEKIMSDFRSTIDIQSNKWQETLLELERNFDTDISRLIIRELSSALNDGIANSSVAMQFNVDNLFENIHILILKIKQDYENEGDHIDKGTYPESAAEILKRFDRTYRENLSLLFPPAVCIINPTTLFVTWSNGEYLTWAGAPDSHRIGADDVVTFRGKNFQSARDKIKIIISSWGGMKRTTMYPVESYLATTSSYQMNLNIRKLFDDSIQTGDSKISIFFSPANNYEYLLSEILINWIDLVIMNEERNFYSTVIPTPPLGEPIIEQFSLGRNKPLINMALIKSGTFTFGTAPQIRDLTSIGGEKKINDIYFDAPEEVKIDKDFYIGTTEVTQEQWLAVMGYNPSNYNSAQGKPQYGTDRPSHPVESVSYVDCLRFIEKLNEQFGDKGRFRLPTPQEWEYSLRANHFDPFIWGFDFNSKKCNECSWNTSNSSMADIHTPPLGNGPQTHAVAQKEANSWGLYDMLGNVREWVEGDFSADGIEGIVRGGSFDDVISGDGRLAYRSNIKWGQEKNTPSKDIGFRLAFDPNPSSILSPTPTPTPTKAPWSFNIFLHSDGWMVFPFIGMFFLATFAALIYWTQKNSHSRRG